ncbi:MAG: RNA polymerase sigma factor [Candidatus Aminicenantes bacterium]|nr:RNA polymerase sigma factor [Candidatus Aminicenantes bacterium]
MTIFDEIYDMYTPHIYRFARALTRDAGDAEDLFQETWLRAYRAAAEGVEPRGSEARAWLFAIAANAHRDQLRKKRVRRLFLSERKRSMEDGPGEDGAARSDIRLCLRRAMARLPGKERRVFVLKDIEGFKHDEIARVLGIPEATVRTLLHRAVKRLRKDMAEFRPVKETGPIFEEGRT